jgi:hypothetical protein
MAAVSDSPGPPAVRQWTVRSGGVDKAQLLMRLEAAGVVLNEAARRLFADPRFTTSPAASSADVVETSVAALGFPEGAAFEPIVERAAAQGLFLCPLELGPHLRLQWLDQAEGFVGQPASRHRAPPGSLTVASAPLADDDETPKGFYLRRIEGVPWLRGYLSWPGHCWSAQDMLLFTRRPYSP